MNLKITFQGKLVLQGKVKGTHQVSLGAPLSRALTSTQRPRLSKYMTLVIVYTSSTAWRQIARKRRSPMDTLQVERRRASCRNYPPGLGWRSGNLGSGKLG